MLTSLDQLLLILKTFLLFIKTSYINEEVKCTELSLSVSVPCHFNPWLSGHSKFLPSTIDLLVLTSLDQLLLILKTFLLFSKTSYINEEVNCTELSLSVSVPWHFNPRL